MDLSARNLHLLHTDHWLSDARNVTQVWLQQPAFVAPATAQKSPADQMKSWSVAGVASFFESKDADALGKVLSANSVQGVDLMQMTQQDLVHDLRVSLFAARKICALRDAFLM